jgi:PAS domain S-box-containing protein
VGSVVGIRGGQASFLADGGDMGARIRAFDWAATPLGPPAAWPQSLKAAVRIVMTSRYAMFVWWGRNLINIYNDVYAPMLGARHPAALGRPAPEVWSEIWDKIGPRTEVVLKHGEATFDEDLLLLMDRHGYREEAYFTFSYSPLLGDDGGIGGLFAVVTEGTQKVIGERRLKLLNDLAASVAGAHSVDGVCDNLSAAFARYRRTFPFVLLYLPEPGEGRLRLAMRSGLPADHPGCPPVIDLGRDPDSWHIGEARALDASVLIDDLSPFGAAFPAGEWDRPPHQAVTIPIAHRGQAAATGFMIAGVNPYRPFDGAFRGFVGLAAGQMATGLANARAYEEERRRAEALAEIDRAKTVFFSNVSHEFRTPLTLLLGPLEDLLVAGRSRLSAEQREQVDLAHRNALRLLKLVNTLLDFSRIEAGRVQASFEATDLSTYTAELASAFRSAVEKAGLRLIVDCAPLAGPVYVDRDMWEKIVLNLLSNALKFTLDGEIEVGVRQDGDAVILSVRDTGTGIPEEEHPRIFQRFHRVRGARSRTHEGTGIGLALVQELVRLHGGTIAVDSAPGRGSLFTVRLPTGQGHLPPDRINAARSLATTAVGARPFVEEALRWLDGGDGEPAEILPDKSPLLRTPSSAGRPRVLLVDDNADMRDYLRRLMQVRYDVAVAADGEAALTAIRRERPDLVLTDVMMPGLDGFGLLRAIRSDERLRDVPVIMLSARAGEEASVEGLAAGADDYLVKPFSARELLARVHANLETARVRAKAAEVLRSRAAAMTVQAEDTERRFRLLVDAVTDYAIFMLDPDGRVVNWNPGAQRIKGYAAAEITGQHFSRFYSADDVANGVPERMLRTATEHGRAEAEGWRVRKDGSRFWASVVISAIRDADGRLIGFAKVTRDLTERRAAEERVRQAQKMEAIGQLTGGVAHDFNNLLAVISGNFEALERRLTSPSDADLRRYVIAGLRGTERAAALTHRLLAFARRQALDPAPVSIGAVINGMSEMFRRTLGETIIVETVLATGLWSVFVDPNELENSLLNLAVNARDAMPGGGKLTLEADNVYLDQHYSAEAEIAPGPYVGIFVSDTGTGMSAETLAQAFEPFFTTKEIGRGTGLGLSQVYGFVRQSGGHVKIYSELGIGTTVKLYLPRYVSPDAVREASPGLPAVPTARGEVVLVVDDDAEVRRMATEMLEELGYSTVDAGDAAAALRVLAARRDVAILFTDLGLPGGMNGRQLADEARRRHVGLKVLYTSGYPQNTIVHHGRLDPGVVLLMKPFTFRDLAAKLRLVLDDPAR